jgi:hypothetical protein
VAPQDDNPDHQAHSPLIGGSTVTTFIRGGTDNTYGLGTLGFFASINNKPKYNNIVLVSNAHVLGDHGGKAGDTVYQPSWTEAAGNWTENYQSNAVGVVQQVPKEQPHTYQYPGDPPNSGQAYWVDCATALLNICVSPLCHTNCGVKFSDVQRGLDLGGASKITGVGRMTAADKGKSVYIVGAASGVIEGTLNEPLYSNNEWTNVMEIVSDDSPNYGDSGSAVVDENGILVGLLHHATGLQWSYASHIGPVLDILGVTPITAANEPDNPAFSGTATQAAQAMAPGAATPGGMLRQRLSETENGRRIVSLIAEHQTEVVHLVNHERAVMVAWHRNKGPQFLSEATANAMNPDHRMPREVDGISRETLLRNMANALYAHGSAGMRALCGRLEELTRYVNASDSVHELVDMLGRARPA